MLVLTRKYDQSIMIGDQIEIVVIDIKGDQVKIGIQAPRDQTILRKEIYNQIKSENELASQAGPENIGNTLGTLMKPKDGIKPRNDKPVVRIKKFIKKPEDRDKK